MVLIQISELKILTAYSQQRISHSLLPSDGGRGKLVSSFYQRSYTLLAFFISSLKLIKMMRTSKAHSKVSGITSEECSQVRSESYGDVIGLSQASHNSLAWIM